MQAAASARSQSVTGLERAAAKARNERESKEAEEKWAREIAFSADIGLVAKDRLALSARGLDWKGQHLALEEISRLRWGGTRHSINGIPAGTTYVVVAGGSRTSIRVDMRRESVYMEFMDKLWKAVVPRLIVEMLKDLRGGRKVRFADAVVDDHGVELPRSRFLRSDERKHFRWRELEIGNGSGTFFIRSSLDHGFMVDLSYQ